MSHNSQPVAGAHGSTRKLVGSGTISTSAAPSISRMPKPPPDVNTGKTVRCEVSLASIVVVMVQPLSSDASASAATSVLPLRIPCWSGNESLMTSSFCSSTVFCRRFAAACCPSDQRSWRFTKLNALLPQTLNRHCKPTGRVNAPDDRPRDEALHSLFRLDDLLRFAPRSDEQKSSASAHFPKFVHHFRNHLLRTSESHGH